ncbi:MAG: amino acid adenylation domain-containing protein [Clostridia bacterium]|nr:amino acid adenylation domain-containing protein [Clostridia bacterium]
MNQTVLKWLEQTVKTHADKVMLTDENSSLTFGEFDRISKAIGSCLAERVAPASSVVVMSGRHVITPAAFLGVVRAGCFYAPMDATMPVSRLNQILKIIKSKYMLVDRAFASVADQLDFDGERLYIDEIAETPIDEPLLTRAAEQLLPTSPLYVIFTSGSTGVPKGVITSHQSLMHYIDAVAGVLDIQENDVLGSQSPFDYIAAVRDIYLPLKTGASTVVVPKNEFSMPVQLFETLNRHKVTTLCWSVAGIELPAKLGGFDCGKPEYLKKVCFSGSVMACKYLKIWQEHLPDVLFVNQYGPTEATASCTYYVVSEKVDDNTVLPIGKPYENYGILLLNEDDTPTAPGEIGEICVKGPVLALGYYGDAERTAQAFIQNPLNPNYRELIYKTGDLGRWMEDGNLAFHGRKDRQIKHMGHRIELGELEKTASEVEGVSQCCAMYNKDKELLYLFYTGEATSKEIVLHFRAVLPAFMVPRKLIRMDELPRLPNGKLDMQAMKNLF